MSRVGQTDSVLPADDVIQSQAVRSGCESVPVFGLQVVQRVIEPLVDLFLHQTADQATGNQVLHVGEEPGKLHIQRKPRVSYSVEDPGSSAGAQVQLGTLP